MSTSAGKSKQLEDKYIAVIVVLAFALLFAFAGYYYRYVHVPTQLTDGEGKAVSVNGQEPVQLDAIAGRLTEVESTRDLYDRDVAGEVSLDEPAATEAYLKSKPSAGKAKTITAELLVIYAEHAPEKQGNIPNLLAMYQGRENVLLQQVREKYCAKEVTGYALPSA